MKKHAIPIVAALLGLLALAAAGAILFFVAGLSSIAWLLCASLALLGGYVALLILLVTTNTRRPAGIDPNAPAPPARDPFAMTSEELRGGVLLSDAKPYGRRDRDDPSVVKRLADYFEQEDHARPAPPSTPSWALDLQSSDAAIASLEIPPIAGDDHL